MFSNPLELVNPDICTGNAMSPDFEKFSADFFGGKEVLTDEQYETKPLPSPAHSKSYVVTYTSSHEAVEVFEKCKEDPKLFQLLNGWLWSGDLGRTRDKTVGPDWLHGAQITLMAAGSRREGIELRKMLEEATYRTLWAC